MKKEEFQRMLKSFQVTYPSFFDNHMFLVNGEGDVEFFEFKMTFNSVAEIDDFFSFFSVCQDYEESLRNE